MPSNTLAQRVRALGDQFAGEVDPADIVADVFQPQTLTSPHLDVLVQMPASIKWQDMNSHYHSANLVPVPQDELSFKRRLLANSPDPLWSDEVHPTALVAIRQFWKSLWQDKEDPLHKVSVRRDPNPVDGVDVLATMRVLHLPKIFSSISDVMIRGDYGEAIRDIEGHRTSEIPTKSVMVVGHPGIGRTMLSVGQAWVLIYTPPYLGKTALLYYILVQRLLEQKPTILQITSQVLFFFSADGVEMLQPSSLVDPASEAYQNTWVLVDINAEVQAPAEMLRRDNSPFFLVIASPPKVSQWQGAPRDGGAVAFWLMKPFTLAELIQASVFLASISFFATYVISQSSTSTG